METSRERILANVRKALGRNAPADARAREEQDRHVAARATGPQPAMHWETLARFRQRAQLLSSTVGDAATMQAAPAAVAEYLHANALPLNAVIWPALSNLAWRAAGIATDARAARGEDMVGITAAFCAIAETGTLLLLSGPDTPSSVSLLPETHVALVSAARIVRTMEQAWALLRAERGALPRAVNFVSGPSRTADIEQTLVLGAHGPYRVHVVIVGA